MVYERRLQPRYRVALPIVAGEESGVTLDISVSGVRFVASKAFGVGSTIEVVVDMSDGHMKAPIAIEARGRVVWQSAVSAGQTATAVKFEEIRFIGAGRKVADRAWSDSFQG